MVSSRALSLATVMLLIGCCTTGQAQAQENLDAGKSPSQIFASTCTGCHKSPRGLLKTVAPGSLTSFLRQHYTTGPDMAGVLASYLASNGATDTRYGEKRKGGKEAKSDGKPASPPEQPGLFGFWHHPAAATAPGAAAPTAPKERRHRAHNAKRPAHPAETPEAGKLAAEGQAPVPVAPATSPATPASTGPVSPEPAMTPKAASGNGSE